MDSLSFFIIGLFLVSIFLIYFGIKNSSVSKQRQNEKIKKKAEPYVAKREQGIGDTQNSFKRMPSIDTSKIEDGFDNKERNLGVSLKENKIPTKSQLSQTSLDEIDIRNKITLFLSRTEPDGAEFYRIKKYSWACFNNKGGGYSVHFEKEFRKAFDQLKKSNMVFKKGKIWALKLENHVQVILHNLSPSEVGYFKYKKLGEGWKRLGVGDEYAIHAIWWLYQNLTPDEFEKFCCALLTHHGVKNLRVSDKRASGADGGIDGIGQYALDGRSIDVLFQAKRYRPNRQVAENELRDFVGTLTAEDIDHGFFITTSNFSKRAIEKSNIITGNLRNNIKIELLDRQRIIEALLYQADLTHGYGLHKTDKNFYYINPEMLRRAILEF